MATELKDRIKVGLDEGRMIVLVVQVLLGFECRAAFEPGFERLPPIAQTMKMISFGILILTLAILLAIPAYHRIAEEGENTPSCEAMLRRLMAAALLPFAAALGIDVGIVTFTLFGMPGGVTAAILAACLALFFWYVAGYFRLGSNHSKPEKPMEQKSQSTPLKDRIKQVLTECRIVLPGTQAFLGFQLSAFLTDAFTKLSRSGQILHLIALCLVALSGILLMTPPAYHRIAEKGNMTQSFLRLASALLMAAMIPLALGISLDFYVVLNKVTAAPGMSAACAAAAVFVFAAFWFGFPLALRRGDGSEGSEGKLRRAAANAT